MDTAALLEALETPYLELNAWEEKFLASVRRRFKQTGALSYRQLEVLEELYRKKVLR